MPVRKRMPCRHREFLIPSDVPELSRAATLSAGMRNPGASPFTWPLLRRPATLIGLGITDAAMNAVLPTPPRPAPMNASPPQLLARGSWKDADPPARAACRKKTGGGCWLCWRGSGWCPNDHARGLRDRAGPAVAQSAKDAPVVAGRRGAGPEVHEAVPSVPVAADGERIDVLLLADPQDPYVLEAVRSMLARAAPGGGVAQRNRRIDRTPARR